MFFLYSKKDTLFVLVVFMEKKSKILKVVLAMVYSSAGGFETK